MSSITPEILTGQSSSHTVPLFDSPDPRIHKEAKAAFLEMQAEAAKVGIALYVGSAFRSFEKQLTIWNEKCCGKRPLLDRNGKPIDVAKLSDEECVRAILLWSALPGYSRHHWGCDLDVFDKARVPPGYHVQFSPDEIVTGPFREFDRWLSRELNRFQFFRPYQKDLGGVQPEWWHISYRPVAEQFTKQLTVKILREVISSAKIEKKAAILSLLPDIFERLGRIAT